MSTETKQLSEDAVRCIRGIDALAEEWRAWIKRTSNWPGEYYEGAGNATASCLEDLMTLRAQIESASIDILRNQSK